MTGLWLLWALLFAAWRWELGRCALLPRWRLGPVLVTERAQMVILLGPLSLPAAWAMGWAFGLVMWAVLALYWTRGHQWESWHKLLYRYGPPGLAYRLAFNLWPERWNCPPYIDGPEAVARIIVGLQVGAAIGAFWLAPAVGFWP